jgi:hypothetical protein
VGFEVVWCGKVRRGEVLRGEVSCGEVDVVRCSELR